MPMQTETIILRASRDVTVNHLLVMNDDSPSDKLMVMLPGRGYTTEHPVMYYLRKMALAVGYDVLSVQYSFQAASNPMESAEISWDALHSEVTHAVDAALERGYSTICYGAKSLGTALAVRQTQNRSPDKQCLILLTPIRDVVKTAGEFPTLAVIGTADGFYDAAEVENDKSREHISWQVYEGLTHSLEYADDWLGSLEVLPQIIGACEAFLLSLEI